MDKFDSLRKSIKQILEQEDQLGRMSPEDYKRLALATQSQTRQDDVEVKDTAPVVDKKVIDDILYRNKYKIGYVEYNGLMHLLCVLKVYGQKNPLPQDLKDFIGLVKDYTLGLFDRQQQDLIAASHNISNKNRLIEADSDAVYELEKHIKIIINHIYKDSDVKVEKLRSDNVANAIKQANNIISSGLGFFTEILFYTYLSNPTIWANQLEEFNALQTVFDLRLDNLKTSAGTYNACVDFAVMYFLLLDVENKDKRSLHAKLNDYMIDEQWNHRNQDIDELAVSWSFALHEPLDHCIEILKKLQNKFSNSKWETGRAEAESSHPQYDLWLVEKKDNKTEVIRAKIDIKSYLPNSLIVPTKTSHSSIGKADFFGFINFERDKQPFTETKISDLKYTIKYLIIKKDEVQSLIKDNIQDEEEGKIYRAIFALGNGDYYHPKEYNAKDVNSETDPFTLEYYRSDEQYVVRGKKPKTTTTFSLNNLSDKEIDIEFIKKYFNLGKIYSSPHGNDQNESYQQAKANLNIIKNLFKQKLTDKLSDFNKSNFPIVALPLNTDIQLSKDFERGRAHREEIKIGYHRNKKSIADHFHINHKLLNKILEESLEESLSEANLKFPFYKQIDNKRKKGTKDLYSILDNFIEDPVQEVFKDYHDIIYQGITVNKDSHKNTVPVDLLMYFIKEAHKEGLLFKLDSQYKKVINVAFENNYEKVKAESYRQTKSLLRNVIKNILQEADKKCYSGSHPEESYGWSAKEEDFMFDKPGLTTWEKDRQRVKEYLRSMGMLASKKEKKK